MAKRVISGIVCGCFLIYSNSFAQNLVYNGSFEESKKCPSTALDFENVLGWHIFRGTPDYFATCASKTLGVPENYEGMRNTFFGYAYAGIELIYVLPHNKEGINYLTHESIFTKTIKPLSEGKEYELSFWISLADSSNLCAKNIYCSFSKDEPMKSKPLKGSMGYWNEFKNCDDYPCNIDFDIKGKWNKVVLKFTAKNEYNYLSIGLPRNHYPKQQYCFDLMNPCRKFIANEWAEISAYYYIDNVVLMQQ